MLDMTLKNLSGICSVRKLQIATAESCTGGLIAKLITDCAGSSVWFERGFITYSNLAKEQMLCVGADLLSRHGAVSEPVAAAMAEGALKFSQAQYSLSVTGIAGPGGGTDNKPVGTVCFGWAFWDNDKEAMCSMTSTRLFSGSREKIRSQTAVSSLQKLYELISSREYRRNTCD
jgi:nicotinamide-nucleotide amidase